MSHRQASALRIATTIPADMLRMTTQRVAADVRRKFNVNSEVAFRAVSIARERVGRDGKHHAAEMQVAA